MIPDAALLARLRSLPAAERDRLLTALEEEAPSAFLDRVRAAATAAEDSIRACSPPVLEDPRVLKSIDKILEAIRQPFAGLSEPLRIVVGGPASDSVRLRLLEDLLGTELPPLQALPLWLHGRDRSEPDYEVEGVELPDLFDREFIVAPGGALDPKVLEQMSTHHGGPFIDMLLWVGEPGTFFAPRANDDLTEALKGLERHVRYVVFRRSAHVHLDPLIFVSANCPRSIRADRLERTRTDVGRLVADCLPPPEFWSEVTDGVPAERALIESRVRARFFSDSWGAEAVGRRRQEFHDAFLAACHAAAGERFRRLTEVSRDVLDTGAEAATDREQYLERIQSDPSSILGERSALKAALEAAIARRSSVLELVASSKERALHLPREERDRLADVEGVAAQIRRQFASETGVDWRRARREAVAWWAEGIESRLRERLHQDGARLKEAVEECLDDVGGHLDAEAASLEGSLDVRAAFYASLAGSAVAGGLGMWAAGMGNLGGYILVAKGVSILATLGIAVPGGTAGAVAAVAAIGGPVVLGGALAVAAGLGTWKLTGDNKGERIAPRPTQGLHAQKGPDRQ